LTALPKTMNGYIATAFRGGLRAVGSGTGWRVSTGVDERFVGDGRRCQRLSTEVVPLMGHFIVAENDEATCLAIHCMLHREGFRAAITLGGERQGLKPKAQAQTVAEFIGRQICAIGPGGHGGEPSPCVLCTEGLAGDSRGAILKQGFEGCGCLMVMVGGRSSTSGT
jgi:hypothetical protein